MRILSKEKIELLIFDTTIIIWNLILICNKNKIVNHLEPNVYGSSPVQTFNIFLKVSCYLAEIRECSVSTLWVFSTTTTISTSYYRVFQKKVPTLFFSISRLPKHLEIWFCTFFNSPASADSKNENIFILG